MKKIILSLTILLAAIASNAQFSSAKLTAAGLTCAMCTKAIYNALQKDPSISNVNTDIKNSSFEIRFKNGAPVDPDALKKAVEEAGFSVSKLSLSGAFNNISLNNGGHVNIGGKVYHILGADTKTALNGLQTLNMVDKKFVSAKEFKKYEALRGHMCLETGKAADCCPKSLVAPNSRVYHVTL